VICKACREAADIPNVAATAVIIKTQLHKHCKGGTWCDCQHRVGRKNTP
jgi:hypothetical protein